MPTDKRPLKVFLCHAHADRDAVRALYTRLTEDGVDAWLDKEKLLPGQDWELEIKKAVREADVVVVCLSKQFVQAGTKHKEVKWALDTAMEKPEGDIFIIPARLEECDNLESLRKWHWVDLFEDDGYEGLMGALKARVDKIEVNIQAHKKRLTTAFFLKTGRQRTIESKSESKKDPLKILNIYSGYHVNGWLAYGIPVIICSMPIIGHIISFILNKERFVFSVFELYLFVLIPAGVWEIAVNRRMVFFITWSIFHISFQALRFVIGADDVTNAQLFVVLAWGLGFDIFLYQIKLSKRYFLKILWGVIASVVFVVIDLWTTNLQVNSTPFDLMSILPYTISLFICWYMGEKLAKFLNRKQ